MLFFLFTYIYINIIKSIQQIQAATIFLTINDPFGTVCLPEKNLL